jgi:hypothetical protein
VPGSKYDVITEAHGIPLAMSLTRGNPNNVTQLMPLIRAIPLVRSRRGRPRQRPDAIYADRGYDHDSYRKQVRAAGITRSAPPTARSTVLAWTCIAGWSSRPSPCITVAVSRGEVAA